MLKIKDQTLLELKIDWDKFLKGKRRIYRFILDNVEREIIKYGLGKTDNCRKRAARFLGINRNTLQSKVKKYGIKVK